MSAGWVTIMNEFTIKIAGTVAAVAALYESTRDFCKDYLSDEAPDISVLLTAQDIAAEQAILDRERALEGLQIAPMDGCLLERTALQRKLADKLFERGILVFHGSAISVDGEAYLFTAKSGTGKSTHTRLWREMLGNRAVMINDDKPFIKVTSQEIQVYGSPWNGKHGLGNNICVPLKAICLLERGEQNKICRIPANEMVYMLLQQSNRPQQAKLLPKYLDILENIAESTAFYRLECNMEPESALISYQAMSGCVKE